MSWLGGGRKEGWEYRREEGKNERRMIGGWSYEGKEYGGREMQEEGMDAMEEGRSNSTGWRRM